MNFIPIKLSENNPRFSVYFKLAILVSNQYGYNYLITSLKEDWKYITNSHKVFYYSFGYYAAAYQNIKTKQIIITHEGTNLSDLFDLFDIVADLQITFGFGPLIQLPFSTYFTKNIINEYPGYEIIHSGVSLGGIISQYQLLKNEKVLSIEAPSIEQQSALSGLLYNFYDSAADLKLPFIPTILAATQIAALIGSTYIYYANTKSFGFVEHSLAVIVAITYNYELKLGEYYEYDHCNLAIANGKPNIITNFGSFSKYSVKYELISNEEPRQPIIKFLSLFEENMKIHDPYTLFYSNIETPADINPTCNEPLHTTDINLTCNEPYHTTCEVLLIGL